MAWKSNLLGKSSAIELHPSVLADRFGLLPPPLGMLLGMVSFSPPGSTIPEWDISRVKDIGINLYW